MRTLLVMLVVMMTTVGVICGAAHLAVFLSGATWSSDGREFVAFSATFIGAVTALATGAASAAVSHEK